MCEGDSLAEDSRKVRDGGAPAEWDVSTRLRDWLALSPEDRDSSASDIAVFLSSLPQQDLQSALSELARRAQDSALPILRSFLGSTENMLPAVEALGLVRSQESARLLMELNRADVPKPIAKAARRALHKLKSQGVRVEEAQASAPGEVIGLVPGRRILRSVMSTVGSSGDQILSLLLSVPMSGTEGFEAIANDTEGLKECVSIPILKSDYEEHLLETPKFITLADAPAEYVIFRLREYERITLDSGNSPPSEYQIYRSFFHSSPRDYDRPLVYEEIPPESVLPKWAVPTRIADLLEEDEFSTWALPDEEVEPYVKQLLEIENSPLVLSEAATRERLERHTAKAIAELFSPEVRVRYKRRLEESAYVMLHTGRVEIARTALACALRLAPEAPDSPPSDLAEAIVKRSIGYLLMASDDHEEGGLIQTARSWDMPNPQRP